MTAVTFDTLRFTKKLEVAGLSIQQRAMALSVPRWMNEDPVAPG
jgi:hypothetical protein